MKISRTMKRKKIDNFAKWRKEMKALGKIKADYPSFKKDGDLAELIGVVLGDGHIEKFPRTESLTIAANSNNSDFIKRYTELLKKIFEKEPYVAKIGNNKGCTRIRVYQKKISKRLNIPTGSRKNLNVVIPKWIIRNKEYIKRYLRGLYEAEGSFGVHEKTSTYKFSFSNRNESLLQNVFMLLQKFGFHPHRDNVRVQLSRKQEVYKIKELIKFRDYK